MTLTRAAKVVRKFGRFTALDGVDLDVASGEVVGLVGANGAGKTTLIRMLLGLLAPTEGGVELFGAPPSRSARRRVGYVPQGLGLYDDLTVAENLQFAAAAYGKPVPDLGPLATRAGALVRDLPLGFRRRAAFANALAHDPELLLLDEPTSGVDVLSRAELWDTIRETAGNGAGVLVTTHHMEEADQCDRVVMLAEAKVVASGTVDEIVRDVPAEGATRAERFEQRFADLIAGSQTEPPGTLQASA
jgi:ABC-2 type transport system ATP-binding protein/ribosome-dependent ATPase